MFEGLGNIMLELGNAGREYGAMDEREAERALRERMQDLAEWQSQQVYGDKGIERSKIQQEMEMLKMQLADAILRQDKDLAAQLQRLIMQLESGEKITGMEQAGALERTNIQEAGATGRVGMQEAGATSRVGMEQAGADRRTGMTIGSNERMQDKDLAHALQVISENFGNTKILQAILQGYGEKNMGLQAGYNMDYLGKQQEPEWERLDQDKFRMMNLDLPRERAGIRSMDANTANTMAGTRVQGLQGDLMDVPGQAKGLNYGMRKLALDKIRALETQYGRPLTPEEQVGIIRGFSVEDQTNLDRFYDILGRTGKTPGRLFAEESLGTGRAGLDDRNREQWINEAWGMWPSRGFRNMASRLPASLFPAGQYPWNK